MSSLTLNILLHLAAASPGAQDYATAYREMTETGRPMVVLIGADWCPGCQQMKLSAMPEVQRSGGLSKVAYAYVNHDESTKLAQRLMRGGSIPQLILFHKTDNGWKREQLTGAHSPSAILSFINQATDSPVQQVSRRESSGR
jgi:thioredoxin-like negative regulator of GroEL